MKTENEKLNLPATIENASNTDVLCINRSIREIKVLFNTFIDQYANIENIDAFSFANNSSEIFSEIAQKAQLVEYYFQRIAKDLQPY